MKNIIAIVAMVIAALTLTATAEIYPAMGRITTVDTDTDIVTIEDPQGNMWLWEGTDGLYELDWVAFMVEDHDNDDLFDDEIITLRYCGASEEWH